MEFNTENLKQNQEELVEILNNSEISEISEEDKEKLLLSLHNEIEARENLEEFYKQY